MNNLGLLYLLVLVSLIVFLLLWTQSEWVEPENKKPIFKKYKLNKLSAGNALSHTTRPPQISLHTTVTEDKILIQLKYNSEMLE